MSHVRSRWTALPLALTLALPVLAALPGSASAEAVPEYRGWLLDSAAGTRYVVSGADGAAVFTSPLGAVDGALGAVTSSGPTVAYVAEQDTATSYVDRLHVATPEGADVVLYTAAAGTDVSEPAVSPDGRTVVFALDDDTTSALLAVDTRSGSVRTVRQSTQTAYAGPSFSPDGSWISWAQATGIRSDVVTARYATGAATVVASKISDTPGYLDATWSPDGTRLLAVSWSLAADGNPVTSIERVELRSGAVYGLLPGMSEGGAISSLGEPTFSADGRSAYVTQVVEQNGDVRVALLRVPDVTAGSVEGVPVDGYAGSPSVAGAPIRDAVAPAPVAALGGTVDGAGATLTWQAPEDADVAEYVVTRVTGAPADTPTATIEVARTRADRVTVPLPTPSTDYGFSVFSRDWSGNLSPAATVSLQTPPASALSLAASPGRVTYLKHTYFSGKATVNGAPLRGGTVTLYVRRAMTSTVRAVSNGTTAADGSFVIPHIPDATSEYYVRYEGNGSPAAYPSVSAKKVVTVVPLVTLGLSASRTTVGRAVTLTGRVSPAHVGQVVDVQRYVGNGAWRTIATTRLSSTSVYTYAVKPGSRGAWTLRVVKRADADHLLAVSPTRTLSVG